MGKKALSVFTTIVLVLGMCPSLAWAADGAQASASGGAQPSTVTDETAQGQQAEAGELAGEADAVQQPAAADDEAEEPEGVAAGKAAPEEPAATAQDEQPSPSGQESSSSSAVESNQGTTSAENGKSAEAESPKSEASEESSPESRQSEDAFLSLEIPKALTGDGEKAVLVSAGDGFYAVLLDDGSLWMWGSNNHGQIAQDPSVESESQKATTVASPSKIMDDVVSIAVGLGHVVVLKKDGSVWTWGENDKGQLGVGSQKDGWKPAKVLDDAVAVWAYRHSTLAQGKDGKYWAWGASGGGIRFWVRCGGQ